MKRTRRIRTLTIAVASCGLLLAGCSVRSAEGSKDLAENGEFTMVVDADLGTMNPYQERQNFGYGISSFLYDSLINLRPDGEIVSGLADSWEATPDSVEFRLRDDVTCSSGEKLTASHIASVLKFNSDPGNASSQYGLRTSTAPSTIVGDDAAGTVSITVEAPDGLLINRIGLLPIVCSKGLADPKSLAQASDGTGPYVLKGVAPGDRWTLTKRDGYTWGPDGAATDEPGTPETVVLRLVADETTATNMLLAQDLNLIRVTGRDRDRLDAADGLSVVDETVARTWLTVNQDPARITASQGVRTALVQALDIDEVIDVSTAGRGSTPTSLAALQPTPCRTDDPLADVMPKFDPKAASAALDAEGWKLGGDGVREKDGIPLVINVIYLSTEHALNRVTVELLASRWDEIGVSVKPEALESAQIYTRIRQTLDYDVLVQGPSFDLPSRWCRTCPDPRLRMAATTSARPRYRSTRTSLDRQWVWFRRRRASTGPRLSRRW